MSHMYNDYTQNACELFAKQILTYIITDISQADITVSEYISGHLQNKLEYCICILQFTIY